MARRKVITIGEITFDILFRGEQPQEARVGGSVLNTSVSLGRVGIPVEFVAQTGNDRVGDQAVRFLGENGVDAEYVARFEGSSRVALAFLDEAGKATYSIYPATGRTTTAYPEVDENDIVLYASSHALKEEGRSELTDFLTTARERGALLIYDPNYRKTNLTPGSQAFSRLYENLGFAGLVKGSDEDFRNIFGTKNPDEAFGEIRRLSPAPLVYTAGADRLSVRTASFSSDYEVRAVRPVSTVGAGDSVTAGLIYGLWRQDVTTTGLSSLPPETWRGLIELAIDFARHVCRSYDNYISREFAANYADSVIESRPSVSSRRKGD